MFTAATSSFKVSSVKLTLLQEGARHRVHVLCQPCADSQEAETGCKTQVHDAFSSFDNNIIEAGKMTVVHAPHVRLPTNQPANFEPARGICTCRLLWHLEAFTANPARMWAPEGLDLNGAMTPDS